MFTFFNKELCVKYFKLSIIFLFSLQAKKGPLLHCLARVLQLFEVSVKVRLNLAGSISLWVWLAQFLLASNQNVAFSATVTRGCFD